MGGVKGMQAFMLVLLMALAPLSGCFGENETVQITENDVEITPKTWTAGVFQGVTITAEKSLSVFVPYLIKDAESGFVVNSTIVDLEAGQSVQLSVLAPPRADTAVLLVGSFGRDNWPIRDANESWATWYDDNGHLAANGGAIERLAGRLLYTPNAALALLRVHLTVPPNLK